MTRWTPERRAVMDALADEILHNYGHGRVMVAIDGVDGSGTTAFAADLVERLERRGHAAFQARIDDFHAPAEKRYARGETSGAGRYEDSYDYSAFRRVLVEPFRLAGSTGFVTAFWDWRRDQPIEPTWLTAPADAILVVNGVFLQRPELRGLFSYRVWLDVPFDDAWQRLVQADPAAHDDTARARSEAGMKLYLKAVKAAELATAVYDNRDPDHPRRIFSDSC
ncbi:MAG TPA: uridine kinase [Pseudolysinimonas sp.]|nr:uridine kinase [Pseudolysinimonas sp.]